MIEIIKQGDIPQASAKCPICECEFIYDRREIHKENASEYSVPCPCCSEKLAITYDNKKTLKIF